MLVTLAIGGDIGGGGGNGCGDDCGTVDCNCWWYNFSMAVVVSTRSNV